MPDGSQNFSTGLHICQHLIFGEKKREYICVSKKYIGMLDKYICVMRKYIGVEGKNIARRQPKLFNRSSYLSRFSQHLVFQKKSEYICVSKKYIFITDKYIFVMETYKEERYVVSSQNFSISLYLLRFI